MNRDMLIVVADASGAKMYTLAGGDDGGELVHLETVASLSNEIRRLRPSEQFSDSRPGLLKVSDRGGAHGVDDHRDAHLDEEDRSFAREIAAAIKAEERGSLVIAASPGMLGHIRKELSTTAAVQEMNKNLTGMSVAELHDYLAKHDVVPPRGRAGL